MNNEVDALTLLQALLFLKEKGAKEAYVVGDSMIKLQMVHEKSLIE
jgi:ribonuclease HI